LRYTNSNIIIIIISENIIKIGPYLPKLLQEKFGGFLAHPVDVRL